MVNILSKNLEVLNNNLHRMYSRNNSNRNNIRMVMVSRNRNSNIKNKPVIILKPTIAKCLPKPTIDSRMGIVRVILNSICSRNNLCNNNLNNSNLSRNKCINLKSLIRIKGLYLLIKL